MIYNISFCSILSAEFLRAAIRDAKVVDSMILSKLRTRASDLMNGVDDEVCQFLALLNLIFVLKVALSII